LLRNGTIGTAVGKGIGMGRSKRAISNYTLTRLYHMTVHVRLAGIILLQYEGSSLKTYVGA
jgi:hypothetical protein